MSEKIAQTLQPELPLERVVPGLERAISASETPKTVSVAAPSGEAVEDLSGRSVHELQQIINEAFAALDDASQKTGGVAVAPVAASSLRPSPGTVIGSAVAPTSPLGVRLVKSALALAVAVVLGLVPLRHLLTLSSDEAFVDAPIYEVTAPAAGVVTGTPVLPGVSVAGGTVIARIAEPDGTIIPVTAPTDGKIWEVAAAPGMSVASGTVVARVAACWARSVTAVVSGAVYDRLLPGMSARFNFFGEETYYDGTVANLLGHSPHTGVAATPAAAADSFRVVVTVPDLGRIAGCAVGRRGNVIFGLPKR